MRDVQIFKDKAKYETHTTYFRVNTVLLFLILAAVILNVKKNAFFSQTEGLSPEASKRDFCSMAMNQVIGKKLSKKIVTESLYPQIIDDNYKNLYFEGEEVVDSVFTKESACKVIVKTKSGIRSFDFTLEESDDFNFYYVIKKIHESELYEKGA